MFFFSVLTLRAERRSCEMEKMCVLTSMCIVFKVGEERRGGESHKLNSPITLPSLNGLSHYFCLFSLSLCFYISSGFCKKKKKNTQRPNQAIREYITTTSTVRILGLGTRMSLNLLRQRTPLQPQMCNLNLCGLALCSLQQRGFSLHILQKQNAQFIFWKAF